MAIVRYAGDKFTGLSGDSKPLNVADGAIFYETNTAKEFIKVSGAWVELSGISGYSGYSGASGISGFSGESGISGYSGFSGISGYSGASGESGYSGESGESGYSGASGKSGYSGWSGASGESGYSGASGISGYSGESGISGFSGFSGISGYSSYSGISGYSGASGIPGDPGALVGITYYTDDDDSDLSGYKNALRTPDSDPEVQYGATGDGTGVAIEEFATILGDPGVTIIESGTWRANVYAYISEAGGTNTVKISVFKRASGGTETLLFDFETENVTGVGVGNVALYEVLSSQPDIVLDVGDRLVFKFLAKSTAGKDVYICVGGSAHYTHVHTPLVTEGHSGYSGASGISGYSGYSGLADSGYSGYSGISGWSGASGISGYSGFSGISGYSGESGISGYSGESGISGYSGFSGISGYSGYSGASGESGYSGYSGESGESGYSGYSGISGYSGFSGISGYSGAEGAGIQYWDRATTTITPSNAGDVVDMHTSPILMEANTAPGTPVADNYVTYVVASGVSPNRTVKLCTKDEAGNEIIIASVVV